MIERPASSIALDQDDITVVSTHLQDAVVKVADIVWLPAERRLVLGLNRFDWEACGCEDPCYKRRRTALRFERVMSLRCRNVRPSDKDAVLNLLAVEFDQSDAPAGVVTLISTPVFLSGLLLLYLDQRFGGSFFDPGTKGSQIIWQHTLWLFGRPEISALMPLRSRSMRPWPT